MGTDKRGPRRDRQPAKMCAGHKQADGSPCDNYAVHGATVCRSHGAGAPHVRAKAAVRAEVFRWGLHDVHADPGEVLLRLVTQSAARAEHYAALLEQAYDAAERLRAAHEAGDLLTSPDTTADDETEPAAIQRAREDLDRVFTTGGVTALVGGTYASTNTGSVYATGETIRGLAKLEADERERCVGFAAKAIAAGLAERQVRLAERQGALIADVLRAVMADPELGLTDAQRRAMPDVARRHLAVAR